MTPAEARCFCGAIILGPGVHHCCRCHRAFSTMEDYDAHLEVVGRHEDGMPDFRCRPERAPWQTGPCPPWCNDDCGDLHRMENCEVDRLHFSDRRRVDMKTVDLWRTGPGTFELDHAVLWIEQHDREVAPRIGLGHNEKPGLKFTLTEAERLIEELTSLVAVARGEVK